MPRPIKPLYFWLLIAVLTISAIRLVVVINNATEPAAQVYFILLGLMIGAIIGILAVGLNALITRTVNMMPLVLGSVGGVIGLGLGSDFAWLLTKDIDQSQGLSAYVAVTTAIFAFVLGSVVGATLCIICGLTKPQNLFRRTR